MQEGGREAAAAPCSPQLPHPLVPGASRSRTELSGGRCRGSEMEPVVFPSAAAVIANSTCQKVHGGAERSSR